MPQRKTREKSAKKFVEAAAEKELSESVHLVERDESSRLVSDLPADEQMQEVDAQSPASKSLPHCEDSDQGTATEKCAASAATIHSPAKFVRLNALNAALFLLFPVICCVITILVDPRLLGNSYCRTAMLCALIWNLIGGVIYAQSRRAWERRIVFLIFALPLALSGFVCSAMFQILIGLMQHLPPGLK